MNLPLQDDEDVRTCFIHLIVAFLLSGDNDVIRRLIQTKGKSGIGKTHHIAIYRVHLYIRLCSNLCAAINNQSYM